MLRVLHIGPAALQTSLVVLIIGSYLSLEIISRYATRRQLNSQTLQTALLAGFGGGLVGARFVFIAFNWQAYHDDLSAWIAPSAQALSPWGGLLVGCIIVLGYLRWKQLPLRPALDNLAPGVGILWVAVSLALLAEGDYFGKQSGLPWAIDLWGADRHPTQLYAFIGALINLLIWLLWQRSAASSARPHFAGQGFLLILIGNAITWLLVGFWLATPTLFLERYRLVQIVMWGLLIACAFLWNLWADADTAPPSSQTSHPSPASSD